MSEQKNEMIKKMFTQSLFRNTKSVCLCIFKNLRGEKIKGQDDNLMSSSVFAKLNCLFFKTFEISPQCSLRVKSI